MEAPSREEEPPRLSPAHRFFLVQDHLSIRTDDAKPYLIVGLDTKDVHLLWAEGQLARRESVPTKSLPARCTALAPIFCGERR